MLLERGAAKDSALEQRQKESEMVRRLKVQEARARSEYIALQVGRVRPACVGKEGVDEDSTGL